MAAKKQRASHTRGGCNFAENIVYTEMTKEGWFSCRIMARVLKQANKAKSPKLIVRRCGTILTDIIPAICRAQTVNGTMMPSHTPPKVHESNPSPSPSAYHWQIGLGKSLPTVLSDMRRPGKAVVERRNPRQDPTPIEIHAPIPNQGCHTD